MTAILSFLGRVMLCAIFFLSAIANKIPKFNEVVGYMEKAGVPQPQIMLGGAIAFLLIGSVSLVLGYRARFGAFLLLIFLGLVSYYFHAFWKEVPDSQAFMQQMIQFQKNMAIAGAMVFIIANGPGAGSLDGLRKSD